MTYNSFLPRPYQQIQTSADRWICKQNDCKVNRHQRHERQTKQTQLYICFGWSNVRRRWEFLFPLFKLLLFSHAHTTQFNFNGTVNFGWKKIHSFAKRNPVRMTVTISHLHADIPMLDRYMHCQHTDPCRVCRFVFAPTDEMTDAQIYCVKFKYWQSVESNIKID